MAHFLLFESGRRRKTLSARGMFCNREDENARGTHTMQITQLYRPNDEDGWRRASSFRGDSFLHACQSRIRRLFHYTHGGAMVYHPF
ncbi:MAG: hypothetical protein IID42_00280 [Planctomycetes bacterium]|nr:hypothetical protein [Planctomycetota bacterium]